MARRRFVLVGLAVVLLLAVAAAAAAAVVWYGRPKKIAVTIEVYDGTSGIPVKAVCEADGRPQEFTGTCPTQFVVEGYRVTYLVTSAEDSGEFRVRPKVGDIALSSASSGNPPTKAIRGWVQSSWWGADPEHWRESIPRDESPAWMRPPPWAATSPGAPAGK